MFEALLIGAVEAKPDITMPELAARLMEAHGVTAAPEIRLGRKLPIMMRRLCSTSWLMLGRPEAFRRNGQVHDGSGPKRHRKSIPIKW
ncbi:hypothetical protein GCM10011335_52950 [Aureimonas glaciei]|uniref:Uncharacterized protein n=1 Tax=Aureimonas glaciei TaxID=1776957 RepID=A0A917DKB6_9HYPH|nr:hypothetical protein GCM10011335_52950 [Aureimonas glaciei]